MGVEVFVMPLTRWVGRAGLDPEAWLARFKEGLARKGVAGDWDETSDVLAALTFSYEGFGRIADAAGRFAGRVRWLHLADPFQPFWIPLRFHAPLEIPDPAGGEEPVTVLSSIAALEELTRLRDLADGEDRRVVESLAGAVGTSVASNVPLIVSG